MREITHIKINGKRNPLEGKSAYEIALEEGFVGTRAEWLDSLALEATLKAEEHAENANVAREEAEAERIKAETARNEAVGHTADNINQWLDEHPEATSTVKDGSVGEVKLADTLRLKINNVFNSVAEMKGNRLLTVGMHVQTTGYYSAFDGGGAFYMICGTKPRGWSEALDNGLYAQLLYCENSINIMQAGARYNKYISDVLNRIVSETDIAEIYIPAGKYGLDKTVVLSRNVKIVGVSLNSAKGSNNLAYGSFGTYINTDCNEAFTTNDVARCCHFENIWFGSGDPMYKGLENPSSIGFTILFSRCNFTDTVLRNIKGVGYNIVLNGAFYGLSIAEHCYFTDVNTAVFTNELMPEGYEHFSSSITPEIGDAFIRNCYFSGSGRNKAYLFYNFRIGTTSFTENYIDFFYAVVANPPEATGVNTRKFTATFSNNTVDYCYRFFLNQDIFGFKAMNNIFMHCTCVGGQAITSYLKYLTEDEIAKGCLLFDGVVCYGSTIVGNSFTCVQNIYKFTTLLGIVQIANNIYDDVRGTPIDYVASSPKASSQDYNIYIDVLDKKVVSELPIANGNNTYCGHQVYYNNALLTNMKGKWMHANGEAVV